MITKNNFFNKNSCLQLFCRSNRSLKRQKSERIIMKNAQLFHKLIHTT